MSAVKHYGAKPRLDLFPWPAVTPITRVMEFGAEKYDAHNWRKGFTRTRLIAAAMRHLIADLEGQDLDIEPGGSRLPHLDHAGCCILFLIALREMGRLTDDRSTAGLYRLLENINAGVSEVRPPPAVSEMELLPRS